MDEIPELKWDDVKGYVIEGKLERLRRSQEQLNVYLQFRKMLESEWESVSDYIKVTKLSFPEGISSNGKKKADMIVQETTISSRIILLPNDFPYNFEKGIEHYVLWKLGDLITSSEIEEEARKLVQLKNADDSVFYINPVELKSILDIEHGHILIFKTQEPT